MNNVVTSQNSKIKRIANFIKNRPFMSCLFAGILSAFSMPPWGLVPFFFIGFSTLLYVTNNATSTKHAFLNGWAFGFGYFVVSLYWIGNAVLVYADEFWWAYPFALIGLPIYLAIFYGLASALAVKLSPTNNVQRFVTFLFFVTLFEWVRGYAFTGFPWNTPGLMWIFVLEIAQLASIGGLAFLTAITFLWASSLFILLSLRTNTKWFKMLLLSMIALSVTSTYIYGHITLQENANMVAKVQSSNNSNIIMIQPNIPQIEKWDPELIPRNLQRHMRLTAEALLDLSQDQETHSKPTIVIWPETALAYYILDNENIRSNIKDLLRIGQTSNDVILITGLLDKLEANPPEEDEPLFSNALVALSATKGEIARYGKHHLVPFGEYMPLTDYLGWTPLVKVGGFESAPAPAPMTIFLNDKNDKNFTFLPLICYEIIFPKYSHAANSANAIVNITNDAWYGDSAGPKQHLAISQFRAIEQSRPVIRVANTGISAMIDDKGRLSSHLPYGQDGYIHSALNLNMPNDTSIFQRFGISFFIIYLCFIWLLLAFTSRQNI